MSNQCKGFIRKHLFVNHNKISVPDIQYKANEQSSVAQKSFIYNTDVKIWIA